MNYSISILMLLMFSFTIIKSNPRKNISNQNSWIEHRAEYPDAGFVLEFKYPANLVIADHLDNCICVGVNTEHYNENEASFEDNTRQWCICLRDTSEFSINHLISSWKPANKEDITEKRDTVKIDNLKAIRVTYKSKEPKATYRQLIYIKKYSTLFEVMNVDESTSEDFKLFFESIKIELYKRP